MKLITKTLLPTLLLALTTTSAFSNLPLASQHLFIECQYPVTLTKLSDITLSENDINCLKFSSSAQISKEDITSAVTAVASLISPSVEICNNNPQYSYLWKNSSDSAEYIKHALEFFVFLGNSTGNFTPEDIYQAYDNGLNQDFDNDHAAIARFWSTLNDIQYRAHYYSHVFTCTEGGFLQDMVISSSQFLCNRTSLCNQF